MTRRQWPGTRELLCRLALSASQLVPNSKRKLPEALRLEVSDGRFLIGQRRCLGSPQLGPKVPPLYGNEYGGPWLARCSSPFAASPSVHLCTLIEPYCRAPA
jgi:hypothetical protein